MKISIIMKPRHSGLGTIFEQAGYRKISYAHFKGYVGENLYIEEIPKERLEEVYNQLQAIQGPQKVILAVRGAFLDTGEQKKTSYFEDIENMILKDY